MKPHLHKSRTACKFLSIMGQAISVIKDTVKHESDKDKAELEERLNFLQTTTKDKMKMKVKLQPAGNVAWFRR